MTTPEPDPVLEPTPDAFDPTAPIRGIYQQAEDRILAALVKAVTAGLDEGATDADRAVAERTLRRETAAVVAGLNRVVPVVVDSILEAARQEGQQRSENDQ